MCNGIELYKHNDANFDMGKTSLTVGGFNQPSSKSCANTAFSRETQATLPPGPEESGRKNVSSPVSASGELHSTPNDGECRGTRK